MMGFVPRTLSPEQQGQIHAKYGPGRVTFYECVMCGHTWWQSTHEGLPDAILFEDTNPNQCAKCVEVQRRNPELMDWVYRVVEKMMRRRFGEPSGPTE